MNDPADDTSLGFLSDLVGYHLRRASAAFTADFAQGLEGTGMRPVLLGIMSVIAANPGVSQGEVGETLGIQRANMVSLINELLARALVVRNVSARDRRAFELSLTAAGEAALRAAMERVREHEERMLARFSTADRARLITLLSRIPS